MVFKLNEYLTNDSYNYSYNPLKIYDEKVGNEHYKYTFRINKNPSSNCIHSKIYKKNILLKPYFSHIYSYNFALHPENNKPSGNLNLSRVNSHYTYNIFG